MAIFNNMLLTNKGQILYAKAQTGIQLNFTKMMVGAGEIGAQNPATLTSLINPKYDVTLQSISHDTESKTATINGILTNANIAEATYICEIGLYAQDPNEGEILYAYGSAGIYGDYMAPASAGPYSWNYQLNAAIGNASNVTVELSDLQNDYGLVNTNTTFAIISGGNQKEINKSIDNTLKIYPTTNVGNVYSVTIPNLTSLTDGYPITVKFNAISTEAISIKVNSLVAKGVVDYFGNAVTNVRQNLIANLRYEATSGNFQLLGKGGGGDATSDQVLINKKVTVDSGPTVGTMPDNGGINQSLGINGTYTIPKGYHNGNGKVTQSITTKSAATYNPSTVVQTIAAGQYLNEPQTIEPVTGTANITDVITGKTFSSANGIGLVGTATKLNSASGTIPVSSTGTITGTINLPFVPRFFIFSDTATAALDRVSFWHDGSVIPKFAGAFKLDSEDSYNSNWDKGSVISVSGATITYTLFIQAYATGSPQIAYTAIGW